MKPTQEQVIAWAREARLAEHTHPYKLWSASDDGLERFATLAYEAGRRGENEAAIEDARTVGGEASAEMEKLIRARRGQ